MRLLGGERYGCPRSELRDHPLGARGRVAPVFMLFGSVGSRILSGPTVSVGGDDLMACDTQLTILLDDHEVIEGPQGFGGVLVDPLGSCDFVASPSFDDSCRAHLRVLQRSVRVDIVGELLTCVPALRGVD